MASNELDAALALPDGSVLYRRLHQLISRKDSFRGPSLRFTAITYLQVFGDPSVSAKKRRWVGLALHKMIALSDPVLNHLRVRHNELPLLGEVLLRNSELDETKIVAGIIIREALARGLDIARFWWSDKVHDSVPYFPQEDGHNWMRSFQAYLDEIEDLRITNTAHDCAIFYFVALSVSDGYHWRDSQPVIPVVLMQNGLVTIITMDLSMQNFSFVDIPIGHVHSTQLRKTDLHDSQARDTEHEPWEEVVTLTLGPWTYLLDGSERDGTSFTLIFVKHEDAEQFHLCVKETGVPSPLRSRMASSRSLIRAGGSEDGGPDSQSDMRLAPRSGPGAAGAASSARPLMASSQTMIRAGSNEDNQTSHLNLNARATNIDHTRIFPSSQTRGVVSQSLIPTGTMSDERNASFSDSRDESQPNSTLPSAPLDIGDRDHDRTSAYGSDPLQEEALVPQSTPASSSPDPATAVRETVIDSGKPLKPNAPKKLKKPQRKHPLGTLLMTKAAASRSTTRHGSQIDGNNDVDEFDFPDNSPRMKRPKTAGAKEPPKRKRGNSDVYAISADDGPKTKTRSKRTAAKKVDYTESDDVGSEVSESEYASPKPKKGGTTVRRTPPLRDRSANNGQNKNARGRAGKSKAKAQPLSISPEKHPVLSGLVLSKPEPKTKSQEAKTSKPSSLLSRPMQESSKQINGEEKVSPLNAGSSKLQAEARMLDTLNLLNDDDDEMNMGVSQHHPSSLPVDKAVNKPPVVPESVMDILSMEDEVSAMPDDEPYLPRATSVRPKRPASPFKPSTPPAKRIKKGLGDRVQAADAAVDAHAPLRLLADPSSPSENAKGGRLTMQPSRGASSRLRDNSHTGEDMDGLEQLMKSTNNRRASNVVHKQIEEGHTLASQLPQRTPPGGSVIAELLSSNSKPLPAPPQAASRAISGYADLHQGFADFAAVRSDPFMRPGKDPKHSHFITRLTKEPEKAQMPLPSEFALVGGPSSTHAIKEKAKTANMHAIKWPQQQAQGTKVFNEQAKPSSIGENLVWRDSIQSPPLQAVEDTQPLENHSETVNMDGETMVDHGDMPAHPKAEPIRFRSSPPSHGHYSSSSHTPTSGDGESEEPEPDAQSSIPTEEAEELEWVENLQPHQRNVQEQLVRVSNQVLRHVVDKETAVNAIAETYAMDGRHVLAHLHEGQKEKYESIFDGINKKKVAMKARLDSLAQKLQKETSRFDRGTHRG